MMNWKMSITWILFNHEPMFSILYTHIFTKMHSIYIYIIIIGSSWLDMIVGLRWLIHIQLYIYIYKRWFLSSQSNPSFFLSKLILYNLTTYQIQPYLIQPYNQKKMVYVFWLALSLSFLGKAWNKNENDVRIYSDWSVRGTKHSG
jgi:hypothetical protein